MDNIFKNEEGRQSSTIEFKNPLLWESREDRPAYGKTKDAFAKLFGEEGISAMDRILREEAAKRNPKDRKTVYFIVPKSMLDEVSALPDYEQLRDLPVVAVVEDEKGGIVIQ